MQKKPKPGPASPPAAPPPGDVSPDTPAKPPFDEATVKVREFARTHRISNAAAAHRLRKQELQRQWTKEQEEAYQQGAQPDAGGNR